jgi:hypothetical protein
MNESQKIYVVYPGYVRSRNDIQWHFFSVRKLMAFYKVDSKLYVIQKKRDHVDSLGSTVEISDRLKAVYNFKVS